MLEVFDYDVEWNWKKIEATQRNDFESHGIVNEEK